MKTFIASLLLIFASQARATQFDPNVPQAVQDQFNADMNLTYNVAGSGPTPLHRQIFGKVDGTAYKNFFESRIHSVGLDSCGGGDAVAACVQTNRSTDKMFVTPNFIKYAFPQIARIMIVFHEARHTEAKNNFWDHDNCPTPFRDENGKDYVGLYSGMKLEGQAACDSTAFGSYGSSTIMVKNIQKYCTNCSEKLKMDADLISADQLNRIDRPSVKQAMKKDFEL